MSGAVVAMLFLSWKPFGQRFLSYLIGAFFILTKCLERMTLGFHSLGQVTTGATLGLVLCVYSERAPQAMILFDLVVQVLLGSVFISIDDDLHFSKNDPDNLFSWWIWGIVLCTFNSVLVVRHYHRRQWVGFTSSLKASMDLISPAAAMRVLHDPTAYKPPVVEVGGYGSVGVGVPHSVDPDQDSLTLDRGVTPSPQPNGYINLAHSSADTGGGGREEHEEESAKAQRYVLWLTDTPFTYTTVALGFVLGLFSYCAEVYAWGYT